MKRIPKLALTVGLIAAVYALLVAVFTYFLHLPIPASVMKMYMFFVTVVVLLVMTSNEDSARELVAPLEALVYQPRLRRLRAAVFIVAPLAGFGLTYNVTRPTLDAPLELRTVHPAPPNSVKVFGKTYNLLTLENPYRAKQKTDSEAFRQAVEEGKTVYFQNCHYCHGDKLDGKGHFSGGFNNPLPANFTDVGTIAQLQESFLFWRIATGGPGLPNEGAPWASPMPVWSNYLTEDEIWKVILFLYDYTGYAPRVMKEEKGHS